MLEAEEDMHQLLLLHQQLQVTGNASENTRNIIFHKAKEGTGTDEVQLSVEMPLTGQAYLWADKYQPHKPRFFNRCNQTHYNTDNPPPKTVQGYKFNIFYPDLIDKHSVPEYFLEACQDSKDFAIPRFHARPPYEDIAFKIVSREWEYSTTMASAASLPMASSSSGSTSGGTSTAVSPAQIHDLLSMGPAQLQDTSPHWDHVFCAAPSKVPKKPQAHAADKAISDAVLC
ncbi:hypothetical protein EK904_006990 [Melospiza melodia maxima]|nr:hypothetical protein EK904_006990 [Melospiza melodia maxima]